MLYLQTIFWPPVSAYICLVAQSDNVAVFSSFTAVLLDPTRLSEINFTD